MAVFGGAGGPFETEVALIETPAANLRSQIARPNILSPRCLGHASVLLH